MANKQIIRVNISADILNVEQSLTHNILTKDCIEDDLMLPNYYYEVLYLDKLPIGYITYNLCVDHTDLLSIAVKPNFRGNGYAKELMLHMEKICKEQNIDKIFLEVRQNNNSAIALYEKLDYKLISTRKGYYTNPTENALIYLKEI